MGQMASDIPTWQKGEGVEKLYWLKRGKMDATWAKRRGICLNQWGLYGLGLNWWCFRNQKSDLKRGKRVGMIKEEKGELVGSTLS